MSKMKKVEKAIDLEVERESWPLLRKHRTWTALALTWAAFTVGLATWSYPIGGSVAYYLDAKLGTIVLIAGSLIGMFWVALATIPSTTKYGIDTIKSSTPMFGTRGSVFSIFLQYASIIGWNCLLLVLFGETAAQILLASNIIEPSALRLTSTIATMIAIIIAWFLLSNGSSFISKYAPIIAFSVLAISGVIMFVLIYNVGISTIIESKPIEPFDGKLLNYIIGIEVVIASLLSYWPYTGSIVRMVPDSNKSIWPTIFAMGLPVGVLSLIGLYGALAMGTPEPAQWIVGIGGVGIGIIVLIGLGIANIGTVITGGYATGVGLRQISFIQNKLSWKQTLILVLLPVALISALIPSLFAAKVPIFLAFLGVLFAPVVGIQITDNLILRRNNLNVTGLFDKSPSSPYFYWKGINIAGFIGILVGVITYLSLLNPVTYVPSSIFQFTTASIPAIILSGLSYYLVTKFVVIPLNKGDYRQDKAA